MSGERVPWYQPELDALHDEFPKFDFWYVPSYNGAGRWCWKPQDQPYGKESKDRATPTEVRAAIQGHEDEIRVFRISAQARNGDSDGDHDLSLGFRDAQAMPDDGPRQ